MMIGPEAQGALIGLAAAGIAWAGKISICYLKLKLGKGTNGKCTPHPVCDQHAQLVGMVRRIADHYQEEKQIGLYTEAIKRANSSM